MVRSCKPKLARLYRTLSPALHELSRLHPDASSFLNAWDTSLSALFLEDLSSVGLNLSSDSSKSYRLLRILSVEMAASIVGKGSSASDSVQPCPVITKSAANYAVHLCRLIRIESLFANSRLTNRFS
jgi:hypothetical protein